MQKKGDLCENLGSHPSFILPQFQSSQNCRHTQERTVETRPGSEWTLQFIIYVIMNRNNGFLIYKTEILTISQGYREI